MRSKNPLPKRFLSGLMLMGRLRVGRPVSTRPRRPCPLLLSCKVQFQRDNGLKPSLPPSAAVTPARRSAASFQFTQFSVTPARETDHGLPGLAVKNETAASSLGEVCFLIATFVQRMRPRRILLILKINIDSFAPAQLALRANLRLLYLAPAPALDSKNPAN